MLSILSISCSTPIPFIVQQYCINYRWYCTAAQCYHRRWSAHPWGWSWRRRGPQRTAKGAPRAGEAPWCCWNQCRIRKRSASYRANFSSWRTRAQNCPEEEDYVGTHIQIVLRIIHMRHHCLLQFNYSQLHRSSSLPSSSSPLSRASYVARLSIFMCHKNYV